MTACKLAIPMAWFLSVLIPKLCHYIVLVIGPLVFSSI
jgi:hypothetical protein